MGKALVQRHVAQQHDLVNKSGEGLLVSALPAVRAFYLLLVSGVPCGRT